MLYFKIFLFIFYLLSVSGTAQSMQEYKKNATVKDSMGIVYKPELKFNDSWFAIDKGQHLVGSMILTIGTANTLNKFSNVNYNDSKVYGAGITLFTGLSKEIWDSTKRNNHFSYKDLCANAVGILIGVFILNI